jgi:hypothetical protein
MLNSIFKRLRFSYFLLLVFLVGLSSGWLLKEATLFLGDKKKTVPSLASKAAHPSPTEEKSPPRTTTPSSKSDSPHSAAAVLDRLINELENSDPQFDKRKLSARLQLLKDHGEEASKAIQDFFAKGEDVPLGDAPQHAIQADDGRLKTFPSLRIALLEVLFDLNDSTAAAASLNVLNTTTSGLETVLAARNLEKSAPGVYRSESLRAAIDILSKLQSPLDSKNPPSNFWMNAQATEIIGYYHASELIPQMEGLVGQSATLKTNWLDALRHFPEEERLASYQRLQVSSPYWLTQLDVANPQSRQYIQKVFSEASPGRKDQLILAVSRGLDPVRDDRFINPDKAGQSRFYPKSKKRVEGSVELLNQFEPYANTPDLKKRIQQIRREVLDQLSYEHTN